MASRTADEVGPFTVLMRLIFKNILMHICITLGLTGNILTLIVLLQKRMRRTSTTQYLAALTLFDSIYLICSFVNNIDTIYPSTRQSDLNPYLFLVFYPIGDFTSNTSVYLIIMFTVERYIAVVYPLHSRYWCRPSRARKIIVMTILICFFLTFPTFLENKIVYQFDPITNRTKPTLAETELYPNFELYKLIYFWIIAVTVQFIPLSVLIILNSILLCYIHKTAHNRSSMVGSSTTSNSNNNNNSTKMMTADGHTTTDQYTTINIMTTDESTNTKRKSVGDHNNSFSDVDETTKLNTNELSSTASTCKVKQSSMINLKNGDCNNNNNNKNSNQDADNNENLSFNKNLLSANQHSSRLSSLSNIKLNNSKDGSHSLRSSLKSNKSGRSMSATITTANHKSQPKTDMRVHRSNVAQQQSEQHKATLLLIATVAVFLICQLPSAILLVNDVIFTYTSQTANDIKLGLNNIANGLIAINASINFILYSCISEKFRQTFLYSFIYPLFKRNQPNPLQSANTIINRNFNSSKQMQQQSKKLSISLTNQSHQKLFVKHQKSAP